MNAKQRGTGVLGAAILATVWLAYSGPGVCDPISLWLFLAWLAVLLPLLIGILRKSLKSGTARYAAVFGTALCGLVPWTVDLLADPVSHALLTSMLGVAAGLLIYVWWPRWRDYLLYLAPVSVAAFVHPATAVFVGLLFGMVFLWEKDARWREIPAAIGRCGPAAIVSLPALLSGGGATRPSPIPLLLVLGIAWALAAGVALLSRARRLGSGTVCPAEARRRVRLLPRSVLPSGCALLLIASGTAAVQRKDHTAPYRTAEAWVTASVAAFRAGKYEECVAASESALRLRPGFAEAYNNMGAAYAALQQWDQAIQAQMAALKLRPDFPLAKSNLRWALEQKRRAGAR